MISPETVVPPPQVPVQQVPGGTLDVPPEESPQEISTFGGILSEDSASDQSEGQLSLIEEPQEKPSMSIVPEGQDYPVLSGKTLDTRAAKIRFALGSEAPTPEITMGYLRNGTEDALRRSIVLSEEGKARAVKEQLIREKAALGGKVTPEDIRFISGLAQYEHSLNPDTILERKYSEALAGSVQNLNGGTRNVLGQAFRDNPEKLSRSMDATNEILTRQEIIKRSIQDVSAIYDKQGYFGWGVDILKSVFPGYNSIKLGYGSPGNESYMEGSVIRDLVDHFLYLPIDEMGPKLKEHLGKVAQDNPALAKKMASAMLSFTHEEQFMTNVFDLVNIVSAPGVGTAARLARRGATAVAEAITGRAARGVAGGAETAASGAARGAARDTVTNLKDKDLKDLLDKAAEILKKEGDINTTLDTASSALKQKDPITDLFNKAAPILAKEGETRSLLERAAEVLKKSHPNDVQFERDLEEILKDVKIENLFNQAANTLKNSKPEDVAKFRETNKFLDEAAKTLKNLTQGRSPNPVTESDEALRGAIRANATEEPNLARMLNDLGDTTKSAELQVAPRAAEILKGGDTSGTVSDILNQVHDFMRPDAVLNGTSRTLSAVKATRLAEMFEQRSAEIAKVIQEGVTVGRAPDEALAAGLQKLSKEMEEGILRNGRLQDAIIGRSLEMPEKNVENIGFVKIFIGQTDGSTFVKKSDAVHAASQKYRLPPESYAVEQQGTGFAIVVKKNLDETSKEFRQSIKTEANTVEPSLANTFLGWLRSADDRVPEFQRQNRKVVVHGRSQLEKVFSELRNEVGRMSEAKTSEVTKVIDLDKHATDVNWVPRFDGDTPPRGYTRKTFAEFEDTFYSVNKAWPTEQQVVAYFTAKKLHDWDYVIRNLGVYRDRARKGYETVALQDSHFDEAFSKTVYRETEFTGKKVPVLPENTTENLGIVIHDSGKDPIRKTLQTVDRVEIAELQKIGYSIIRLENPVLVPFSEKFGDDAVHFIVTKNAKVRQLDNVQVPYRDGWHAEYDYKYFVKQPTIKKSGEETLPDGSISKAVHTNTGEKTMFGFDTRAEAEKYTKSLETARQMLVSGSKELDDFVEKNLPWTGRDFRKLFEGEKPAFDSKVPFFHIENGKTVMDDPKSAESLRGMFPNFQDLIRSEYNDFANAVDKKFLGERSDPLWTVKEGQAGEPFMKLQTAQEVDPFLSLESTTQNVIRNRHFADYKISHTEGWIQQFGHLLDVSPESLANNPVWHIHNPAWKPVTPGTRDMVAIAQNSRQALIDLIGTPGTWDTTIDSVRMKMMDSIYEQGGQSAVDKAKRSFLMSADKDPISVARKTAFHTSIGLFNPYQLVQNAMTSANAVAIGGPVHGWFGFASALPMRHVMSNETLLNWYANKTGLHGMKPEWFKESYQEFMRTGKSIVEGEHTWKTDIVGESMVKTRTGEFLDAGLVFFRGGERFNRIVSWNIAYREWRTANPIAEITDQIRRQLMDRSDLMSGNMTRASNASYQQGIMSVVTQFTSYWTRLSEQMLGKRLTPAEKARVIGLNSMLYGVPIGVTGASGLGALTGGQIPWHENIKEAMLNKGYTTESWAVDAFNGGATNLLARLITGEPTDAAAKLGPGGGSLLKNIFFEDKKAIDILFGAAGQKSAGIWEALDPVMKAAMSPFRADDRQYPLKGDDVIGLIRTIKSVDNSLAVLYAANYGKAYAKNGQTLGDITTLQAVTQLITGATPGKITDMYGMMNLEKDRKKLVQKVIDASSTEGTALMRAISDGDEQSAKAYGQRMAAHMNLAELRPNERSQVFQAIAGKFKDKLNQVRYDFYIKNAPADLVGTRQDTFMNLKK